MKTFKDSSQTVEALYLLDEEKYLKGVAVVQYAFLIAELFDIFRNKVNSKEIVSMLPKELPKDLTPGYCYFIPHTEGIEVFSSLRVLEIKHLLFYEDNSDKLVIISDERSNEVNSRSSPITTSQDSTSCSSNTSRDQFSTANGMNSCPSTPPPNSTSLPSENQILQHESSSTDKSTVVQRPLEPATLRTSPLLLEGQSKMAVPVSFQNLLIHESSMSKSSTFRKRECPLKLILDMAAKYEEDYWASGVRQGMRARIPREDVLFLESKFESLGWKICSSLERSEWWSKEKCYLPSWSPLIQLPGGEFIVGIDIFWCIADCLKYVNIFNNIEPLSRKKGHGVHSLRINLLEDSPQEFVSSLLDETDPDSQFFFVWDTLKSSGWSIQEMDLTLLSIPVNRVAIPHWTPLSSDCLTQDSLSKLTMNRDYFYFVQDAISYLKVFGNEPTTTSKPLPERDEKFPLLPFPTYDASGREDPIDIQERRMICRLAQSPDLKQDDIAFLEGLGWDFSHPFGRRNVILSPWGVLKSASKLADLQPDFDYFRNRREAVSFILKTGSCRTRVSHAHKKNLSICSPSVNSKDEDVKEVQSTEKTKRTNPLGRPLADTRRHLNSLELEREIIPDKNFKYSFSGEDLCPSLSRVGLEGQLKFALNSSADSNSYCFSRIRSVLSALGWNFHFLHQGSSVNLAPWADPKNPFLFRVGIDYFFNSRDICEYLIKHGHKPIAEEPSRHRHLTSVVAAKKKIRKATHKEPKSKPSQELKTNHHLCIVPLPYVTVDDVTLSPMPSLEKEMDTRCSLEIKILLKRARSPPKLNLSEFEQVWDVLCDNSWSAEYEEEEGTTYHRLSNGGVKTHSFANKDEVLDFIRIQLLSRGQDYQKLVDRACFYPETSFPDEEDDDSAELTEEEISEDECDLSDGSEMNISTSLLDDIKSYLEQHDNDTLSPPPPHSPIAPTNGLKRKCLLGNDNDNETVGNGRGATLLQELDAEIGSKRVRWEQAADQRNEEVEERNEVHIEERKVETAELPRSLLARIECAKLNLVPSYFPAFPLGREQEYQQILQHLDQMSQSNSGSLRVSGLHGQGKTITTHIALERFQDSYHQHTIVWLSAPMISSFQDVINGLAVALGMGTISNRSGFGQTILLQQILQSNQGILLVIDEIDILQTKIRDLLLSMANTANSKLLFIGLENIVNPGTFQHSVSFPPYDDSSLSRILDSLTENLFDEKSLKLVSKTFATDGASSSLSTSPHLALLTSLNSAGDVRPMKVFALKCLELAEVNLTTADLNSPVRPIVDMKIVSQCRKDVTPTMTSVLVSFHKNSLHILVSLVCSYRPGQLFSLVDMQSAVNTFYLKRCMEVINLDTVVLYAESLLQDGLLSVARDKKKKQFSSLNQYLQVAQVPYFSIGYEPDYLLESLTANEIGEKAVKELVETAQHRKSSS